LVVALHKVLKPCLIRFFISDQMEFSGADDEGKIGMQMWM